MVPPKEVFVRPVPWYVDLTFAAALGSSDDLVPPLTFLHDLQHRRTMQQLTAASASLPAIAKCHERALQRFLGLGASDGSVDASLQLASTLAYLAATQWQPRHRL
eukprot:3704627-Pleurochrysis_carterae.AAC.1